MRRIATSALFTLIATIAASIGIFVGGVASVDVGPFRTTMAVGTIDRRRIRGVSTPSRFAHLRQPRRTAEVVAEAGLTRPIPHPGTHRRPRRCGKGQRHGARRPRRGRHRCRAGSHGRSPARGNRGGTSAVPIRAPSPHLRRHVTGRGAVRHGRRGVDPATRLHHRAALRGSSRQRSGRPSVPRRTSPTVTKNTEISCNSSL